MSFIKRMFKPSVKTSIIALSSRKRLNLGCGFDYKEGWVNVDMNKAVKADIHSDFMSLVGTFKEAEFDLIEMMHSIGYLNMWQAELFLKEVHKWLQIGGALVLEFPDVEKCAQLLLNAKSSDKKYLEAIRAFYAFDLNQIANQEVYVPYVMGYSHRNISEILKSIGFTKIVVEDPQTHKKRVHRDVRVVAFK